MFIYIRANANANANANARIPFDLCRYSNINTYIGKLCIHSKRRRFRVRSNINEPYTTTEFACELTLQNLAQFYLGRELYALYTWFLQTLTSTLHWLQIVWQKHCHHHHHHFSLFWSPLINNQSITHLIYIYYMYIYNSDKLIYVQYMQICMQMICKYCVWQVKCYFCMFIYIYTPVV